MAEPDSGERRPSGPLRRGWTTGACATAAATAAYQALLTGAFPNPVTITLPKGEEPSFPLKRSEVTGATATASIVKDAGDDPDVTHGAEIVVTVVIDHNGGGVTFHAGDGVGTVTKPGLALAVGEPAINPGPRRMIESALKGLAKRHGRSDGVSVTIAVPGGDKLAAKTLNGRLGIRGGLSILGTTGVVIPYSCSAWIHSIHRGIDVARALGLDHLAAATGSTSEAAVKNALGLPEEALIDMGDFVGGTLKYLRKHPVPHLTLAGGVGKITKLAQGAMDLHSSKSRVDMAALGVMLATLDAPSDVVEAAATATTAAEALVLAHDFDLPLGDLIALRAREVAMAALGGEIAVAVNIYDRNGKPVGHAG